MPKKSNTNKFILNAKKIHGDKYNYDKVNYKNCDTKVVIQCPLHGYFEQTPYSHLRRGAGCPVCSGNKKSNTDEFIKKAKEVHENKYNYDKVQYKNNNTKVVIGCLLHGYFEQSPSHHLNRQGCPVCGGSQKSNTDEFIKKAKEVHENKYNYDKVQYKNNNTKVVIQCLLHGDFEQSPASHLNHNGCPVCGGRKKSNTDEFIEKAKEIHGNKYNYDKVNYKNCKTKVLIGCLLHGYFEQTPNNHVSHRMGCPVCGGTKKSNTDKFIEKAKEIHGNKYNYDKVDYKNNKTKVVIQCLIHGDFEQTPSSHLHDHGCPICGGSKKLDKDEFIEKAKEIHGNKYNYDKVNYKNSDTKILIGCPLHGDFEQSPNNHIYNRGGCPVCSESKGETAIRKYFEERNMKFKAQYSFKKSTISRSKFDFAIQKGLIEFHGGQHYFPCDFGSKKENNKLKLFIKNIARDFKKEQWCKQHKIPLLVIPYWDIDRIPEILDAFLAGEQPQISDPPQIVLEHEQKRSKILDRMKLKKLKF